MPTALQSLAPLGLIRGRRMGKRAYRRRILNACVAAFFIPLMAITPETVQATHIEAMTARAITAAAVGQTCGGTRCVIYGYDDNGNMETREVDTGTPVTDTFGYDFENRLISADIHTAGVPAVESYAYDADGIRVSKIVDGNAATFVVDKNRPYAQVIEEWDASALTVRYVHGDDLISQTRGLDTSYYHYDGQVSVRQLTDDAAAVDVIVTDTCTYDAFGNEIDACGVGYNDYRYTGEQRDANTGFYYLRARYMDPGIARFVTRDPFGGFDHEPLSLHKYLYANADPVDRIDPSGHFSLVEVGLTMLFTGILIGIYEGYRAYAANGTRGQIARAAGLGFLIGAGIGATLLGAIWGGVALWVGAVTGGVTFSPAIYAAFKRGECYVVRLTRDQTVYRYFDGKADTAPGRLGHWWTNNLYPTFSEAKAALSLPPVNEGLRIVTGVIPEGTKLLVGTAAANFGQPGGGLQVYIKFFDLTWVTSIPLAGL